MKKLICIISLVSAMGIAGGLAIGQDTSRIFNDVALEGNVVPHHQVVITSPLEGKLDSLLVKEDQKVAEGELIAQMDDKLQAITLERAKLAAESESELNNALLAKDEYEIIYKQSQNAEKEGAAREWEVRRNKLRFQQTVYKVEEAKDKIKLAKIDLKLETEKMKRYQVRAPFAGRIFRIAVEKGQTVKPNEDMFVLYAIDKLKAEINLPGELFGKLKVGQTYWLQPTDKMNTYDGKPMPKRLRGILKTSDRQLDGGSFTYRCSFIINNTDENLPAGFSIRLLWPQPLR